MKATPAQIKRIHSLLPQVYKEDPALKADLVASFSKYGLTSTKELEVNEAKSFISHLLRFHPDDRMRKKILSICHELGWHNAQGKLDWQRISNFLKKYGHAHKGNLNAYTTAELPRLVTQFENMLKKEYRDE